MSSVARVEDRESNSGSGSRSLVTQPTGEQQPTGTSGRASRLESFEFYPLPHYVNVLHLAKSGFTYTPTARNPLGVTCVGCGKVVNGWKDGDRPFSQEFHEMGCQFARAQTPSEHSGSSMVTDVSENLLRASVHSNEESTKPLETATTSGGAYENQPLHQLPQQHTGMRSYIATHPSSEKQLPARQAFSMPPPHNQPFSIAPPGQYSLTRLRSRQHESGSRTTDLEHIQAQHPASGSYGHRSFSPSPLHSLQSSVFPQSTIHGSISGAFSPTSFAAETHSSRSYPLDRHSRLSVMTHPQSEYENRRSPSSSENPEDIINRLDMRDAQNRLLTFEYFWSEENVFRNYRLLVVNGLYCLAQGDAVECFCCHIVIANWERNDNPRTRHIEMSPICRFMKGDECGNVPLAVEHRRPPISPSRRSQPPPSFRSHRARHHSSSSLSSHLSLSPRHASHHSTPEHSLISQPSMEVAVGPSSRIAHPSLEVAPLPGTAHPSLQGATASAAGPPSGSYSHPTTSMMQRSNLLTEFPCLNPANPAMREEHARLQTFNNQEFRRHTRLRASNETLAQAGLYYIGDNDRVKCWFCDGGLRDFQPNDDPWVEHAKFFPQCEHLLQQRGPAWINTISVQNPNINRPIFPRREARVLPQVVSSPTPLPPAPAPMNPDQLEQYRNQMLEDGMNSQLVQTARDMGYSDDRIRQVQWHKILLDGCCYQSVESLVNAIMGPNEPDSPTQGSTHQQQQNVIEMPGQTVHVNSNVIGPSVVNEQYVPPYSGNNNVSFSTTYSNPGNGLYVNGQPMEEFMANAFDHPFFRGEMDHLMPGTSTTVYRHSGPVVQTFHHPPTHTHIHHPPVHIHHPPRPRAPTPNPRPAAPTVAPPPRPPLQAITIPRRASPRSTNAASSATTSTTSSNASSSSAGGATGGATAASTERRLEALERERTCKICLNAQSDILFQPCGHICACENCARMVRSCPVCRAPIQRFLKTYLS